MGCIQDIKALVEIMKHVPPIKRKISNFANSMGFRYTEYNKHVTIYPNGHGIQIFTCTIKILDKTKCNYIYRNVDLNDAGKDFVFPTMKKMLETDYRTRFKDVGFWYQSENNFISGIEEFYWSETNLTREDLTFKRDQKHMRWRFKINRGKIENNRTYDFCSVLSVPNMFPITDGKFDKKKQPYDNYEFNSICTYDLKVNKMTYILSFDRGIVEPEFLSCAYYNNSRKEFPLPLKKENNFLYNKYIAKYKNLSYNNKVHYRWELPHLSGN